MVCNLTKNFRSTLDERDKISTEIAELEQLKLTLNRLIDAKVNLKTQVDIGCQHFYMQLDFRPSGLWVPFGVRTAVKFLEKRVPLLHEKVDLFTTTQASHIKAEVRFVLEVRSINQGQRGRGGPQDGFCDPNVV